jgi:NADP-dependent alcohol dehydrogenase
MIGHELTVLHGIDHGRTLAILMPATLKILAHKKREKLLQYADRVWNLKSGTEDERISKVIECTELFFQSLHIDTRLNKYGITTSDLDSILKNLERHGMINLGETGEVSLQMSRKILEAASPL